MGTRRDHKGETKMSTFKVPEFNFKFSDNFEAYQYQIDTFNTTIDHMRESNDPAYIYASVSAGKSLLIAMIAKHFQNVTRAAHEQGFSSSHKVLMLVRTGDLVKQNAEEAWTIDCQNSIWCSGLIPKSMRSSAPAYDCVMGSEKSVFNSLFKELSDFRPTIILIDECHMVPYENEDTQMMKMIREFQARNKNVKIIGLTGSPWRGRSRLLDGNFWKKELVKIDRPYLTKENFVMPVTFGFGDGEAHYDSMIDDFEPSDQGDDDISAAQLKILEEKILKEGTHTQKIMLDVMMVMENRNVALITCAGKRHCEEAAKYLPEGSYAIVTEQTPIKERIMIKELCNSGSLKYVLQVGCWTVGVSIPRIDTIVIMRLIGSLVVYEQLIGRGVRKLKQDDINAGIVKNECLVLDYTDTSAIMASLFSTDELDEAENQRAKQKDEVMRVCSVCNHENSMRARRCSGRDSDNNRCEEFFSFSLCEDLYSQRTGLKIKQGCGVKNDQSSRVCRGCGGYMTDPNARLNGQHYGEIDLINVIDFKFGLTKKGDKLVAQYNLENGKSAKEIFDISSKTKWKRAAWYEFLKSHIVNKITVNNLYKCYDVHEAMKHVNEIRKPYQVTHRVNDKGFDILARKIYEE